MVVQFKKHKNKKSLAFSLSTIFTQDKEFTKRAAYENQELTNLDGSTSTIDSGDVTNFNISKSFFEQAKCIRKFLSF